MSRNHLQKGLYMFTVLVVDDKKSMQDMLEMMLQEKGYRAIVRGSALEALSVLKQERIDIMITDMKMPQMSGLELLEKSREISPATSVILITAYGTIQDAVKAMKLGAVDFIAKPFSIEEMECKLEQILLARPQTATSVNSGSRCSHLGQIIGHSLKMQKLYGLIEKVAPSSVSVLVVGESGTGKELVAREIHNFSHRHDQPFIPVNCGALVENLLEDELFGHVPGSFTGAQGLKKGRFEMAYGGTLFLDEIAEIVPNLQVKLLRVLQEKCFERVGSSERIASDVRIIAATNQNLPKLLELGKFREDLYYRLNVITLEVPPLRERKEDIRFLCEYYLATYAQENNKKLVLAPETLACLETYSWPGNVRQLQNAIARGVLLAEKHQLQVQDLPAEIGASRTQQPPEEAGGQKAKITEQLETIEREAILQMLQKHHWNQTKSAQELGMGRTALQYKMKKYGIGMHNGQ